MDYKPSWASEAQERHIDALNKEIARLNFEIARREKIMEQQEADVDRLDKRIKELEKALEPIRGVWTRYDDYPMFGPSGAEYAEAVKRCMWILEKEVSDG